MFLLVLLVTGQAVGKLPIPSDAAALDTITFTRGQLSGAFVSANDQSVKFENAVTGVVTINWNDIQSLQVSPDSLAQLKKQFPAYRAGKVLLVTSNAGGTAVEGVTGQSGSQPPSDQTSCGTSAACSAIMPGWQIAKLKIQTAIVNSTKDDYNLGGELDVVGQWHPTDSGWPHQRTLLQLVPSYDDKRTSKPFSANITRDYDANLQHLFFLNSNRTYAYLLTDFYVNNSLGIYLQQSYGGGFGALHGNLELDADVRFVGEHFYAPSPSASLVGSSLSERYYIPIDFVAKGATISEVGQVLPVFNKSAAWQLHGILELNLPITKKLSFAASVFENYVENTPASFRQSYFKAGVGLQFTPNPTK
jgi:hypothetical protein